jgi:hypothetical protein
VNPLNYAITRKNKTIAPSVQKDDTLIEREPEPDIDFTASKSLFNSLLNILRPIPYDVDQDNEYDEPKKSASYRSNKSSSSRTTRKSPLKKGGRTRRKKLRNNRRTYRK